MPSGINIQEIASALDGKLTGQNSWICRCPAHEDKEPSLSINTENGRILFHCHAGCTQKAVLNALKSRGLWPKQAKLTENRIVATYDYQDEAGTLLFQVVRKKSKNFVQRRPDGKGGWIWNLKDTRRVLYRLPEILDVGRVFIPEGEKDVNRLTFEGLVATTCPGGAGKWRSEYSDTLRGKDIVILPDNDEPGRTHALKVAESMEGKAKSAKILELPGLPEKGDVSDWLDAGHTKDELLTLALQAEPVNLESVAKPEPLIRSMPISEFLELKLPPRQTLLDPWLLSQGLCMIHAYRSTGKTFFSLGVACAVATGSSFLKWSAKSPAGVLYVDGEMAAVSLQERLTATLADMGIGDESPPLHIITPDILSHGVPDLSTLAGQAALEAVITPDIKLIILDNLSCLCRTGQENRSESWLPVQAWCLKMRSQGKSILLVHHDGKTKEQRGTSKKEDLLDTVIQLTRPGGYRAPDGCVFELHYRKARELHGDVVRPFEARLTLNKGKPAVWTWRDIEESTRDKVRKLLDEGWQSKDIASELQIAKSLVSKYKNEKIPDTSELVNYSI